MKPTPKGVAKSEPQPQPPRSTPAQGDDLSLTVKWHLRIGWWALLIFLTFGIILESLHGFKINSYLGVGNQTRRFMWTLAHAHGTLLALVNLAFAATLHLLNLAAKHRRVVSMLLSSATILMPAGFFLGGLVFYGGDPGFGILLLPLGAVFLLSSVFLIARATK